MCQAFAAYSEGDYAKAVDLMSPVRYHIKDVGGSNAQVSSSDRGQFCWDK